jgi:hypothetical protein
MELDDRWGAHAGFEFTHDVEASRAARALVHTTMPEGPMRSAVELAASELVTNVVKHTQGGGLLRLWTGHPTIRVEVEDTSSQAPVLSDDFLAGWGRSGLAIVGLLCNRWGFSANDHGKVVWAEFIAT